MALGPTLQSLVLTEAEIAQLTGVESSSEDRPSAR